MFRNTLMSLACMVLACASLSVMRAAHCNNPPVSFELSSVNSIGQTTAISSDGGGLYMDGQDGVSAVLNYCSGSGDATLNLNLSKRSIAFDLRQPIATAASTPAWTTQTFTTQGFLNIRNLLWNYNPTGSYSFTTKLFVSFAAPDRKTYGLRMVNDAADTPPWAGTGWMNSPCETSRVSVQHVPADSTRGAPETWIASVDSTVAACMAGVGLQSSPIYVATLVHAQANTNYNDGQFSLPFQITIRRLQ